MLCTVCNTDIPAGSSFCPKCGQPLSGGAAPHAAPVASEAKVPAPYVARSAAPAEAERQLWKGSYSPKAMIGWWMLEGIVVIAAIVISILVPQPITWIAAAAIAVGLALWLMLTLLIKRLSLEYTLTTEQLTHKAGLLTRTTNRIEIIDIDDVTFQQTLIERFVNVGSVSIVSSDRTHPRLLLHGIDDVQRVSHLIDSAARDQRRKRGAFVEQV